MIETTHCPYCGNDFKRVVKSKTKCKQCGDFVYKRTTLDGKHVVVTEKERDRIDAEHKKAPWISPKTKDVYHRYFVLLEYNKKRIRKILKKPFWAKINDKEAIWAAIKHYKTQCIKEWHYGLYRNAVSDTIPLLLEDKKFSKALDVCLSVCYMDHCNASNGNIKAQLSPWLKKNGEIVTHHLTQAIYIADEIGLSYEELIHRYRDVSEGIWLKLKAPIEPAKSQEHFSQRLLEVKKEITQ